MNLAQAIRPLRLADVRLCLVGLLESYKTAPFNSDQRDRLQLGIDKIREEISDLEMPARV